MNMSISAKMKGEELGAKVHCSLVRLLALVNVDIYG